MEGHRHPLISVIDPNTLAALGLKQLLQTLVPVIEIDVYGSFSEFTANHPEQYVHYFASMNIVLENRDFFLGYRHKTIVITMSKDMTQLPEFHSVCVNVPEHELVRSLLMLMQHAHGNGNHLPPMPRNQEQPVLSNREAEVMALIVKGYINKEIADMLHIGLATVITHRKNIMEKLGVKSVSALTIYAVMHGFVDINQI
ncbi:MAG: LuxR C-terminal-related transcriptional regulator [Prevotella sp.]|nr:LuxR C-terminal-related transcriptional regulator [Prevotella sp.]